MELFSTYRFRLSDVMPDMASAASYLHLDDAEHPAYIFLKSKMEELAADSSLEAIGGYRLINVEKTDVREGYIQLEGQRLNLQRQVCGYMREASTAALFVCTAGKVFSEQYREYSNRQDFLEAYITDAIGSLTVENAMDKIHRSLGNEMEKKGMHVSNRYSPGYCNWPLTDQQLLFRLIGYNPTEVSLSESCLMYPTKSVSGIIGIGEKMKRREYGCAICSNKTCIYRTIVQKT